MKYDVNATFMKRAYFSMENLSYLKKNIKKQMHVV